MIKKWLLNLVVLIVSALIISRLLTAVQNSPGTDQFVRWLILAGILALGMGITGLVWAKLSGTAAITDQAASQNSRDSQALSSESQGQEEQATGQAPGQDPSTRTPSELETLRRERDDLKIHNHIAQNRIRHLQAVLHSIPEAAMVTDSFGRLVLANRKAEEIFGFKFSEGTQSQLDECIRDQEFLRLLEQTRQSSTHKVVEYSSGDGVKQKFYDVILSSVADGEKDKSAGVLAIMHDVTREREAARMKTDFVSSVSHELRTPLACIRAYLEMLVDGEVQDEKDRRRFYEVMQTESARLSNLIDNILNISRIEAGVVKVSKQDVPLAAVIKETIEVLKPQADAAGISLLEELTPVFFHVRADREMMRQAVFNLISNALKYTPRGGTVTVRVLVDELGEKVTAQVADTGVGISPEDLPRLFDKFYRVAGSDKMAKGTGLGLALVKEIVETVHAGEVNVTSELNKGSTFSFTLPLTE